MEPKKTDPAPLVRDASGDYIVTRFLLSEAEILAAAEDIVTRRFYREATLTQPEDAIAFLRAKLALLPHEVFSCLMLDNRHQVLAYKELFTGTIDGCSVHPREVVKQALAHNAAAMIFAHPHPLC